MVTCRGIANFTVMDDDSSQIISGFDGDAGDEIPFAVDFGTARQLAVSGSTCDVYECTVQRRRVFVKRLKAIYRDNPLYRAAFSKEFDLGVSLSHPSLPRYTGFGGDYIVMDFIEGDTLAGLIERNDHRLKDKRFVRKLLHELVDVAAYLHNRHIVHCDIKPDNIMIPPYPDRPAILIDFDKAYSPWLDSTHGSAEKYGCEGCADGVIDFKGIGLIAGRLGHKKMARACDKSDITPAMLKKSIDDSPARRAAIGFLAVASAGAAVLFSFPGTTTEPDTSVQPDDVQPYVQSDPAAVVDRPEPAPSNDPPARLLTSPLKPAIDNAWISSLIAEKSARLDRQRLALLETLDCDTVPAGNKIKAIYNYIDSSGIATSKIIFSAVSRYHNINEIDVQNAVRTNPGWIRLTGQQTEILNRLNDFWQTKESPHPSDPPVSPPDTAQDAHHYAQRH